jgi:hypothetical protein
MIYENNREIDIYKGKYFSSHFYTRVPIVIAFDLDETLGSFGDLDILWNGLTLFDGCKKIDFNKLIDLYPEFLRYGILHILEFIYQKKKKGVCDKIFIYTNNQCSTEWCKMIAKYFNYKLKTDIDLFDQIICAFKINNKIVEVSRTTNRKTYNDFINCTVLPKKTKICFIDNSYFYEMKNDRVYYIQPLSYVHNLSGQEIIDRFIKSDICVEYINNSKPYLLADYLYIHFTKFALSLNCIYPNNTLLTDINVAKKLMYHIKEFFYLTQKKNRTKKIKFLIGRFTRKRKGT